jgi:hypothetical protein
LKIGRGPDGAEGAQKKRKKGVGTLFSVDEVDGSVSLGRGIYTPEGILDFEDSTKLQRSRADL